MTEAMWIAVVSGLFGAVTALASKSGYDKIKANGDRRGSGNGNGHSTMERIISERAAVEFQTRMTLLMEGLTGAIEKGHDRSLAQMTLVGEAITEAAGAISAVHDRVKRHDEAVKPALETLASTHSIVKDIRRDQQRRMDKAGGL